MAILAILPWPYVYYQLLRWIIFISGIVVSYGFYKSHLQGWMLVFGAITILFNPIFPVYLYQKSYWIGIDLIIGIIFLNASGSSKKGAIN